MSTITTVGNYGNGLNAYQMAVLMKCTKLTIDAYQTFSILFKLFEKHIYEHLYNFLHNRGLLDELQSRLRKNHLTETACSYQTCRPTF